MKQLKKSKRPVVLTVKGKAAALDIAAQDGAREGIRQGLEDLREGRVPPAREFFVEFEIRAGALDGEVRIIGARRATSHERRFYEEE